MRRRLRLVNDFVDFFAETFATGRVRLGDQGLYRPAFRDRLALGKVGTDRPVDELANGGPFYPRPPLQGTPLHTGLRASELAGLRSNRFLPERRSSWQRPIAVVRALISSRHQPC